MASWEIAQWGAESAAAVAGSILIAFIIGCALSIIIHTFITGISPMPTLPGERRALLAMIPDAVFERGEEECAVDGIAITGTVVELGAGWGGLALALARHHPERTVLAYEQSPLPWAVARIRAHAAFRTPATRSSGVRRPRVLRSDFFTADLSEASLVVCYLSPALMARLKPKLEQELKPGAMVLSNTFAIPGWTPEFTQATGGWFGGPIYRYVMGTERGAKASVTKTLPL